MRITKAMGEAAKRELESLPKRTVLELYDGGEIAHAMREIGWGPGSEEYLYFDSDDFGRNGEQVQTALCLIMAIAGVKP